jgi:hypothetical protein
MAAWRRVRGVIYIRDEGHLIRNGINVYPRRSASVGFIVALGRLRFMLRYSRVLRRLYCAVVTR